MLAVPPGSASAARALLVRGAVEHSRASPGGRSIGSDIACPAPKPRLTTAGLWAVIAQTAHRLSHPLFLVRLHGLRQLRPVHPLRRLVQVGVLAGQGLPVTRERFPLRPERADTLLSPVAVDVHAPGARAAVVGDALNAAPAVVAGAAMEPARLLLRDNRRLSRRQSSLSPLRKTTQCPSGAGWPRNAVGFFTPALEMRLGPVRLNSISETNCTRIFS